MSATHELRSFPQGFCSLIIAAHGADRLGALLVARRHMATVLDELDAEIARASAEAQSGQLMLKMPCH